MRTLDLDRQLNPAIQLREVDVVDLGEEFTAPLREIRIALERWPAKLAAHIDRRGK
jgi:hypothetical protein